MRRQTGDSAFTLLELLVALALMAALTTSLYVTFRIAFSGRQHAEAALAPVRTATQTMELLRADIESAMAPTGLLAGAFTGTNGTTSAGKESDTLSFYSCASNPDGTTPQGDVRLVQYSLVSVLPTDATNTLQRGITTNLLAPEVPTPVTDNLCQNVIAFTIQYFDGSAWSPTWDSAAQGDVLPSAVQVTLELQPPPTSQTPVGSTQNTYMITRIFLPPCSPAIATNQVQGTQGLNSSSTSSGSSTPRGLGPASPSRSTGLPGMSNSRGLPGLSGSK